MFLRWDTGIKWDKTNLIALVFLCIPLVFHSPHIKPVGHGSTGLLQARFFQGSTRSLRRQGSRSGSGLERREG